MRLEKAKKKFKGQWIAFKPLSRGNNPDGEVLLHNKSKRRFNEKLILSEFDGVYITYAGPIVPKGYSLIV